ncbi:MAG: hypothetical protein AB7F93_09745 [Immundisolibacter sp.]|uniref:restriction endonuclease subunit S n=1 Tax=Immundisolibacter sp. TaxID=1934948 RepID=UPI003D0ED955
MTLNLEVSPGMETAWCRTTVGALGALHCGQSPKSAHVNGDGSGVTYVSGPEHWDGVVVHRSKWTTAPARLAPARSVFITVKGSGVGTLFPGIDAAIGRDIYAFEPHPEIDFRFVYRALQFSIQDVIGRARGDIPGLSKSHILDHPISVPGPRTQVAVASKIDELFSEIEDGGRALDRAQRLAERYRQSILRSAVTGELTREWRERNPIASASGALQRFDDSRARFGRRSLPLPMAKVDELPELPSSWTWTSLDSLADVVGGITVDQKRSPDGCDEVPYLRVANVQRGYLDLSEVKTIVAPRERIEQLRLQPGDILFNEGGDIDKLGRGWLWQEELPICIHQNHVFRARLYSPGPWNKLISWFCNVLGKRLFMDMGKQTTNLASLSLSKLKSVPVPLMSHEEAVEVVSRAEDALSVVDKYLTELAAQRRASANLRQAVLKAAFSGQLAPHDPSDEPASALLARIATESTGIPIGARGRRRKAAA